jgi:Tol biopolymer transport system component
MNDHDARMLTAWFDANEVRGSEASLGRALAATKGAPQRPGWLVSLRGGTIAGDNHQRKSMAVPLLAATALIAALVAGAVIGGGGITPRPIPSPVPPSAPPSVPPPPSPTLPIATEEARGGLVAFTHIELLGECPEGRRPSSCYEQRLWVANPDGSNAHELLPRIEGRQIALGWSPDGRWLLFDQDWVPTLTDATGSEVRPLPAAQSLNLGAHELAFSPDSTRLAFFRDVTAGRPEDGIELAILDIASGHVVSFESTRFDEVLGNPQWSPDGAWIAYERQGLSIPGKIFIIRPDGTGRRALTSNALPGHDPQWSPDGSALAFTSSVLVGDEVQRHVISDIYILPLDGGDPVRLTSDKISGRPSWTLDGRLVFNRAVDADTLTGVDLWVMSADGSGPERLDAANLAALSEVGCVTCIYPPTPPGSRFSFDYDAFWQPTP